MPKRYQKHFKEFIKKNDLFSREENIIVSFSGGVDSVVLIDLLVSFGYSKKLELVHFNHLNRKSNAKDETFVRKFCKEQDLSLKVIRIKNLRQENFEKEAREARYKELLKIAGGRKIIFGHHIDDSFEWHLMQSFKSSSLKSSIGIPLVNENFVRPLMCFSKKQILSYASLRELVYVEDPTNKKNNHERNYIRNVVVPKIAKKYPSYLKNYVSRATKLALTYGLTHLKQKKFICVRNNKFSEIYSFDFYGAYDQIDEMIVDEVKRLSSKDRSSLRGQIQKIKTALKNNKLGPLLLIDGLKVYLSYNHIYISKEEPFIYRELVSFKSMSIDDFKKILVDRNTFFSDFVTVSNYKLNTIKRAYPFDIKTKGKISAIDLLRQWSKKQNKNRSFDLVF